MGKTKYAQQLLFPVSCCNVLRDSKVHVLWNTGNSLRIWPGRNITSRSKKYLKVKIEKRRWMGSAKVELLQRAGPVGESPYLLPPLPSSSEAIPCIRMHALQEDFYLKNWTFLGTNLGSWTRFLSWPRLTEITETPSVHLCSFLFLFLVVHCQRGLDRW